MSQGADTNTYEPGGLPHAKLGMWLFLASEIMLFSTLFTSYIVFRSTAPAWPHGWEVLNIPIGTINTALLIASSVTIVLSHAAVLAGDKSGFKKWMWITIVLAVAFLVIKLTLEWPPKFAAGHYPSTNMFYAVYFTITGLHALHVVGGIVVNVYLALVADRDFKEWYFPGRIEAAGLYWHFVDIVWIFAFPTIYLL